jgi:hypothetical protein
MKPTEPYRIVRLLVLLTAIVSSACEVSKSSNPLSPTVAGPIPGVNITTPKVLEPSGGQKIPVDKQPITLLIENATSNSVRPLYYSVDVATDPNFANKVFTRDKITPGNGGRTSVKLPDALATGKTYYWRAIAQDGANSGAYTTTASFEVYTPIVINAPGLVSPEPNTTVAGLRPNLTFSNSARSGPVGAIGYVIQVASDAAFANQVAAWILNEQPARTVATIPVDLKFQSVYYWRVQAFDVANTGAWSPTWAFTTPTEPIAAPAPPPMVGGPVGADGFNLAAAVIESSPAGVVSWPVTTKITSLAVRTDGVAVEFSKKSGPGRWPDVIPPGWTGGLQYTLWIALNIAGTWHTCSPIEFWYGLAANGGDITVNNQIAVNWTYYCGPMARQPAPGEMVGFFVTAGDQRLKDAAAVHERSNIVVIPFPAAAGQTFTF